MLVSDKIIDEHKRLFVAKKEKVAMVDYFHRYDESNPFSKILRGEAETELVDETPYAITIKNANQRTDTYNLVIPVYPAADLLDLLQNAPDEHKIGYMQAITKAVRAIHPKYQTRINELHGSCARVLFNVGPYSQNTVNHCHAHVTGDNNPVRAYDLLLPEAAFERFEEHVRTGVVENKWGGAVLDKATICFFEAQSAIPLPDSGKIYSFKDGYKFGIKDIPSYLKEIPSQETLKNLKQLACFLTAFNQMSMCLQNGQGKWGGRLVIDTPDAGSSEIAAASGNLLKKLPQTPLTVGQQKDYFDNLVNKANAR